MARKRAMDLLARREHSRHELLTKLLTKGCSRQIAELALDELEQDGLLSEDRFIESLVQTRRNQGHGPVRIRHDLREKGIADSSIEPWLDERAEDWLDILAKVRRQKFGDELPGNFTERARQARFLQSRGFTAEQIRRVLNDDELY
ncbi:MAG: recombination regulator RecX [Acidiferrobacterales bacterium]|jgi:regulatory protein|nr:recombination regulator RecX [Acidiferrobacterales bacterium]